MSKVRVPLLCLLLLAAATASAAGRSLKVYISVDMEGIAGVVSESQVRIEGSDYSRFRALITDETNAAIAGAFAAGATEVVVSDAHGHKTNILIERLDPRAELITGDPRLDGMMEGIDETFDAVVFVGYHASSGAMGILDHTNSNGVAQVRLNGVAQSEGTLNAALAGHHDVPVVFVSGDDVAVDELHRTVGSRIEATVVKQVISRSAARTISIASAHRAIETTVRRAVESRQHMPIHRIAGPVKLEIEFTSTANITHTEQIPGVQRVDGRTIAYTAPDLPTAYRLIRVLVTLGARRL